MSFSPHWYCNTCDVWMCVYMFPHRQPHTHTHTWTRTRTHIGIGANTVWCRCGMPMIFFLSANFFSLLGRKSCVGLPSIRQCSLAFLYAYRFVFAAVWQFRLRTTSLPFFVATNFLLLLRIKKLSLNLTIPSRLYYSSYASLIHSFDQTIRG